MSDKSQKSVVKADPVKTKLDGTLAAATKRLVELHEIVQKGTRTVFDAAIESGRILCSVRTSRRGRWLEWLADSVPYSQPTAWRYIWCYEHQSELFNVNNLTDAYALLKDRPGKRKRRKSDPEVEELVSKGVARDERDARRIIKMRDETDEADEADEPPVTPVKPPVSDSQPQRAPRGWQPDVLSESDLTKSEGKLVKHIRAYLDSVPMDRAKVFMRFVRESITGEL